MRKIVIPTLLVGSLYVFSGCPDPCKKDPHSPDCHDETELITTVIVDLGQPGLSNPKWRDVDGAGGSNPTIDTVFLTKSMTYNPVKLILLDESKTPVDTISHEIEEEAEDHQFFFNPTLADLTVEIMDKDKNNKPVGLESKWTVGANTGTGSLRIVLKHQPGIKDGSMTTGETDVDVTFPVVVK